MLMAFYTKSVKQTLDDLQTTSGGLSAIESKQRLRQYGPNSIKLRTEPLWRKLLEPFLSVFMAVLVVAIGISLWHRSYFDAAIIGAIILMNALIYYVQRFSTERILRSLQKRSTVKVEVLRKGKSVTVDAVNIVPGDVIVLDEGDKIPADARIIEARSFRVDESQLTGESLPISKQVETLGADRQIYEQSNMVFQGSFVIGGEARAVVVATGNNTEFGRLSDLSATSEEVNPVERKIDTLITQIVIVISLVALVTMGLALWRGIAWDEALRFVIALSVSAVPENLPIAISIILVLAMQRMARRKALVRTMGSIESIGAITTIATDKTGTLTHNKLSVQELWHPRNQRKYTLQTLADAIVPHTRHSVADPLDTAFRSFIAKNPPANVRKPVKVYQFEHALALSGALYHNGAQYALALKGAPEQLIERCNLTEGERERATIELHHLTGLGFRVIALGHAMLKKPLESLEEISPRQRITFDGFVAIADTLRTEAKSAIATAQAAGITVRMITGDHFETAYHIGKELGLVRHRSEVFDSRQMSMMSDDDLAERLKTIRVCARVLPEYKHRILEILKQHDITAMTGDGVNDIPALTNAHVGVAMGSGAQIAKDAGDIILLDNNFQSIVSAIHEGRTVYANIKRMVTYLLSTNLGEVLVSLGSLIVGLPLPLTPVQILWINIVTDSAMVIPIGMEPGEARNMKRPPKPANAPLLSTFMISRIIIMALLMAVLVLTLYALFDHWHGADYARTVAFCALATVQWAGAFEARSDYESLFRRIKKRNTPFLVGLLVAIGLQLIAIASPFAPYLHVAPITATDFAAVTTVAFVLPIIVLELHKWFGRTFLGKRPELN